MSRRPGRAPTPNDSAPVLPPSLVHRRTDLREWLDREDSDPVRTDNTYRQFPVVNRWIARWPTLYRLHIRPLLDSRTPVRLLDVGCGGGDVARALARWAERDNLHLEVTGIDPDPRAPAFARREGARREAARREAARREGNMRKETVREGAMREGTMPEATVPVPAAREAAGRKATIPEVTAPARVTFRRASTTDLVAEGARFELVVCNHVLHHLAPGLIHPFLEELGTLATRRVLVSDIERSRLGYLLFSLGTALPFRNSYIRTDGLVSIRRSFTAPELREILPPGWRVERLRPWRLLALRDRDPG